MDRDISVRLKKLRLDKGMTQDDLAGRLHVTRQAVSGWEMGKTAVSVEYLAQLAEIFEVSADELIYGRTAPAAYLRGQRRYVVSSLVCAACLVVCLIMHFTVRAYILKLQAQSFIVAPSMIYTLTVTPLAFLSLGGLIPSLAALRWDIRLPGGLRKAALAIGGICIVLVAVFLGLLFEGCLHTAFWLRVALIPLPFLLGSGLFLGLNR